MGLFGFKKKKVYNYKTVDSSGRANYIGSSSNPARRNIEHSSSGKRYSHLVVTSGPLTRGEAERRETRNIKSYKRATGKKPRYNKTSDGKFHW